ncbi:diacylglycerol/lipid kinase family protein [Desmospora profundinema]|uniref:YegS/Rv2252/BmrU family lipid kinase n=1 Tax=Desmospora profundinema TaxID=1571184 RepID=A0ABU1IQV7_9BACL|nr:diacylglycerol kinase family lipid kinase [Desmospora profundinema]MDR6227165.1 YegS/Rv2252/BmrU family lipid kinase [Desmospora profundinema]
MHQFIVNPLSGNGRGIRVWSRIKTILEQRSIPHQVAFTQGNKHATELARSVSTRPDIKAVVAVGGDGTVHEVGNGLVGSDKPLGYIQAGSGNDFAIAQGIPTDPLQAFDRVLQHRVRRIDTAKLHERFLIGFSGIGFDGLVAETVNLSSAKRWLGKMVYPYAALQTWVKFRPAHATLTIDGEMYSFPDLWLIAVTNIPNYGGGMLVCPEADDQDGSLDICCVSRLSHGRFLKVFPSVFKGKHARHPSITMKRGKTITIQTDPPLTVHADGEVIGQTPLSIQIQPQSLSIL